MPVLMHCQCTTGCEIIHYALSELRLLLVCSMQLDHLQRLQDKYASISPIVSTDAGMVITELREHLQVAAGGRARSTSQPNEALRY